VSSSKSREAAYSLLLQLIKKSPKLMSRFIKEQLSPLLEKIKKPNKWNYQPPGSTAALQKYVGLKNLGCICYMNSMMQ
jgi:ubiquitin carboxyl-terminal hydrolase 9/24